MCFVRRNGVIHAHKLSEYPVQRINDEAGVLEVGVYVVGQMCRVPLVSDIVYDPECPWDMQPN